MEGSRTSIAPNNAPHVWKQKHWHHPVWCKFCTKFIWGLGYQGQQVSYIPSFQQVFSKII